MFTHLFEKTYACENRILSVKIDSKIVTPLRGVLGHWSLQTVPVQLLHTALYFSDLVSLFSLLMNGACPLITVPLHFFQSQTFTIAPLRSLLTPGSTSLLSNCLDLQGLQNISLRPAGIFMPLCALCTFHQVKCLAHFLKGQNIFGFIPNTE